MLSFLRKRENQGERDNAAIEQIAKGPVAPYEPHHRIDGVFINSNHAALASAPLQPGTVKIKHSVPGSLRREDAAKIYELAYFASGDTIDLGTNHGLSAVIAAGALKDAKKASTRVHTVDLDGAMTKKALGNFQNAKADNIVAYTSDAAGWLLSQTEGGHKFGFAFIDHSHAYDPVADVCKLLSSVLRPSAYVAFHDFIDRRNFNGDREYSVAPAAIAHLDDRFEWAGAAGCMGIFRLRRI